MRPEKSEPKDIAETLREAITGPHAAKLDEMADVPQPTITRFLQGADIRLSGAAKLCRALRLELKALPETPQQGEMVRVSADGVLAILEYPKSLQSLSKEAKMNHLKFMRFLRGQNDVPRHVAERVYKIVGVVSKSK